MPRARAAATPALLEMPLSTVTSSAGARAAASSHDLRREAVADTRSGSAPGNPRPRSRRRAARARTSAVLVAPSASKSPTTSTRDPRRWRASSSRGGIHAGERADRQQPVERQLQVRLSRNPRAGVHAPQHRVQVACRGGQDSPPRAGARYRSFIAVHASHQARRRRHQRQRCARRSVVAAPAQHQRQRRPATRRAGRQQRREPVALESAAGPRCRIAAGEQHDDRHRRRAARRCGPCRLRQPIAAAGRRGGHDRR